ncbi:uncharacterized protein E0L32_003315 [Thyridium curvatum]|uniref:Uncharacterized protein n=1 Tax=Thyridium curvatum TaxID=1093900 RepID=A0A507BBC2_9PEZI|nr:uncharacterized protein E0L32_003315 [Thyridium curvatum]TPX17197.1 hypothetical protein E0L32_003315 [Thyridium curvatum]
MPGEHTPLIATVQVGPPRHRYPHNIVRRFCTIALSSILIWFLAAFLFTVAFGPKHPHHRHRHGHDQWSWPGCKDRKLSYEQLKEILLDTPDSKLAEKWLEYYTSGPHLAGQNYSQALWTKERWEEWGVASDIVTYDVYLNKPVDHRVALLEKSKKGTSSWKVAFEAPLKEDVIEEDPTSALEDSVPTFHGYSASGNVTAPIVYVNYGSYQDYEDLLRANVSLEGKIALARYGGMFRGLKVKRAQELGMVGAILFSDPGDDGEITEENGYKPYPEGPARQPSSVQRGSVQFLSFAPGDPTTPGYPSKPGVPRGPTEGFIPSIPSVPISYRDALPILQALNGHGPKAKDFNKYWTRNLGLKHLGVDYNIGPTPDDLVVNLYNKQDYSITPIWNVIGVINGSIPDEVIVVGNHRDAWVAGGAVDPNSGSSVLNEVVRSFGKALENGWKPLRTIVFASWDGEEYGLLGSTEWVEEFAPWLDHANVAYLNLDTAIGGKQFGAAAAPLLNNILYEVTAEVQSPDQSTPGQTVRDTWDGKIKTMGSGSDFTAFQDRAGIPCAHVEFGGGHKDPVYHYHSNYDSFYWVKTFGDPGFKYHRTMAQIFGLMTAKLADEPVVSFSAVDYADALDAYIDKVADKLDMVLGAVVLDVDSLDDEEQLALRSGTGAGRLELQASKRQEAEEFKASLDKLYKAVWEFAKQANTLDARADELRRKVDERLPWWRWPAKLRLGFQIRKVNDKYKQLERNFLYEPGLDGRDWFKHVVFAPGLWTGYAGAVFPGLDESIDAGDYKNALRWVDIIESCILKGAESM